MKFGIVVFPGSNCDEDTVYVLKTFFNQEVIKLWHKDSDLQNCDCIVLPGGFSYGDYLRSGAIARFSPIMNSIISFANKGGYVVGICNGFQILTEAGLLPGALLKNNNQKFICKNIFIRPQAQSAITSSLDFEKSYKIPIAHGEGRFYAGSDILKELEDNQQILFRYCDEEGHITSDANPNGSLNNIAGICNLSKNVMGMMPHPERASDPLIKNTDGAFLFHSLIESIQSIIKN